MMKSDRCEIYCYNEETVNRVKNNINSEDITGIVKLFKIMADENRAKIIFALSQEKELCVCDVANIIDTSVATASHHLRSLRKMGLATYRKQGKLAFYSLESESMVQLLVQSFTRKEGVMANGR
ncbi:metalloregulator ArsR/SmtB family transcription factor [Sediminibacillus dalangtanensis]|uniref:Metalloregulator ArsR/SmtB family transcription factor n=1 Tax=Sediminibacillus dalangtanensis TaxID=2729421 RepID=A0ABX7VWN5_9BACI|nr:metalloregulator ArsR/SmtB family transcription factor [Sediminibacillus dalangtanensis]QTN01377.1 metalloregulator ArsR/SmtB family transcription factor [Sediminibacillus dalangtanensis]